MGTLNTPNLTTQLSEARLAWLLETVDELHSAISENKLAAITDREEAEVAEFLVELIYVARETLNELESRRSTAQPELLLVRKSS